MIYNCLSYKSGSNCPGVYIRVKISIHFVPFTLLKDSIVRENPANPPSQNLQGSIAMIRIFLLRPIQKHLYAYIILYFSVLLNNLISILAWQLSPLPVRSRITVRFAQYTCTYDTNKAIQLEQLVCELFPARLSKQSFRFRSLRDV